MAKTHGKDAIFKLADSGGVLRDISAHLVSLQGLPGAPDLHDVTGAGAASGRSYIRGLESIAFTARFVWDDAPTTGSWTVVSGLRSSVATASFEFGPAGDDAGDVKISGECWLTRLSSPVDIGNATMLEAAFQVDGGVAVGTF